jgi:hypothetical protein
MKTHKRDTGKISPDIDFIWNLWYFLMQIGDIQCVRLTEVNFFYSLGEQRINSGRNFGYRGQIGK